MDEGLKVIVSYEDTLLFKNLWDKMKFNNISIKEIDNAIEKNKLIIENIDLQNKLLEKEKNIYLKNLKKLEEEYNIILKEKSEIYKIDMTIPGVFDSTTREWKIEDKKE